MTVISSTVVVLQAEEDQSALLCRIKESSAHLVASSLGIPPLILPVRPSSPTSSVCAAATVILVSPVSPTTTVAPAAFPAPSSAPVTLILSRTTVSTVGIASNGQRKSAGVPVDGLCSSLVARHAQRAIVVG